MSYTLNRTDGTVLTDLIDGVLDIDTTDLALVGRNYTGYGEFINENFIKLLENFANPNSPVAPMRGQLWYDSSENKLKVFDGEQFQSAAGSFVTDTNPNGPVSGDTWFKTDDRQFYLWNGTEWILIGPQYNSQQGTSGFVVETIQDRNLNSRTVLKLFIGNVLQAVVSREEFIPNDIPGNIVDELVTEDNSTGTIFKGYNIVDKDNFVFTGKAESAQALISTVGEIVNLDKLLRNDINEITTGSLGIRNSAGLTIGASQETRLLIDDGFVIQNTLEGDNFRIRVNSNQSTLPVDAITVNTNAQTVGIFQANPQFGLDVTGDVRVTGNLTVEGESLILNTETLEVENKNIVLANTDTPTDEIAAGGGIILKGTTDKTIVYDNVETSWNISEHVNIPTGKQFRINNSVILDATRLYDSVTQATGITQIGTLSELTVDNIRIDNSTISRLNGTGLTIAAGDITVSNGKITGVNSPTDDADAANKVYVEQTVQTEPIVFSLDVTGWVTPTNVVNAEMLTLLEELYPASAFRNGKEARIATFWYGIQTTDEVDLDSLLEPGSKTFTLVQASGGGIASVLQDINLPLLETQFQPQLQRQVRRYIISGGVWTVNS